MKPKKRPTEIAVPQASPASVDAVVDGENVKITAQKSIELRCGKALVRLSADGNISIEGINITSVAQLTHRLRGGHIALN
jgi:hypothetical protein